MYLKMLQMDDFVKELESQNIRITPLISFYSETESLEKEIFEHKFIINYSNIDISLLEKKLQIIKNMLK